MLIPCMFKYPVVKKMHSNTLPSVNRHRPQRQGGQPFRAPEPHKSTPVSSWTPSLTRPDGPAAKSSSPLRLSQVPLPCNATNTNDFGEPSVTVSPSPSPTRLPNHSARLWAFPIDGLTIPSHGKVTSGNPIRYWTRAAGCIEGFQW
jgi:hypothetical protein